MVDSISTRGISYSSTRNLTWGQNQLSLLSKQLTTGKFSTNLSDYSTSKAQKLLNFNSTIDQQKGFGDVIVSIKPRMEVYNSAMTGIEDISAEANTALINAGTYNPETNSSFAAQIKGYMGQMEYFLNQQVGERYVFSGSRYGQAPVGDITALPVPPTETAPYLATGDHVPAYDTDYLVGAPNTNFPQANVKEQIKIDTTKTLIYGVTSNEDGFQQIIMGLRWAYAATQDQANYDTYMTTARDLMRKGQANVRATHTDSTNSYTTLLKTEENIESKVRSLISQVDKIQEVDKNEVAVKITTLQAQLQASFSAVGNMINLSILKYL